MTLTVNMLRQIAAAEADPTSTLMEVMNEGYWMAGHEAAMHDVSVFLARHGVLPTIPVAERVRLLFALLYLRTAPQEDDGRIDRAVEIAIHGVDGTS